MYLNVLKGKELLVQHIILNEEILPDLDEHRAYEVSDMAYISY
jgi:hypothetical protein